jgi:predicted nucleotidyltransferase
MADLAYLSFRLTKGERDRLKAVAQQRKETVQKLMRHMVGRLLAEHERGPPDLADVLRRLRAQAPALRQRGVEHLWIFGSVARGEATRDSDVDLVVAFAPEANVSLTGFASLRSELSDILKQPVDLAEWRTLRPHLRESAERESVAVF